MLTRMESAPARLVCALGIAGALLGGCEANTTTTGDFPAQTPPGAAPQPPGVPPQTGPTPGGPPTPGLNEFPTAGAPSNVPTPPLPTPNPTPTPGPVELPTGENPIPCAVQQTLGAECLECHNTTTNWGAPMPLVSYEDFHATAPLAQRPVYEVAAERIVNGANPMPPAGVVPAAEISPLSQWLAQGAPMGTAEDANCQVTIEYKQQQPEPTPPPVPANAECYEFLVHGGNSTSPYNVRTGETYAEFIYDVPWNEEVAAVNWRTVYDNTPVLHHWLMYSGRGLGPDGTLRDNTVGSHIGQNVELVAGWAVGGNDVDIPEGIAMDMAGPGEQFLIEWHFFNAGGVPVGDRSGIEVCVVPKSTVDPSKLAGLTWIGTEFFNGPLGMPAGQESKFSGTCTPSRAGLGPNDTIKIFGFLPHMHQLGTQMKTWILRADGTEELVFDKPFQFDRQMYYPVSPELEVRPGDRVKAECTFLNDTSAGVAFGPSSEQEMCYQFTFSYPVGALANGVPSLAGATNTCW